MKKRMEILAPAGEMSGVIAAINGGADAIYLGSKKFNARQRADNFEHNELKRIIQLCHEHQVKVYLTLNILIKDSELQEAVDEARYLWIMGVDALIVQDPGLIYLLRNYFPEIDLQTSTQASVFGLAGVLFFQDLGFKRVVLPREMSLDEVRYIYDKSKIELKVFGHGALCFAYSGQCLFSSLIGGRSGNRGCCAQPCRKKYQIKSTSGKKLKSGYLMSMKDLNTRAWTGEIADAGVASLKIEGRMKGPAYIYATVKTYHEELSGESVEFQEQDLKQIFNREFTSGWLMKDLNRLNQDMGRNQGVKIGRILEGKKHHLKIKLMPGINLNSGDGISFGVDAVKGMTVKKFSQKGSMAVIETDMGCDSGLSVFRTMDRALMEKIEKEASKPVLISKELVDMIIFFHENEKVRATIFAFGNQFLFVSEIIPIKAQKYPLSKEIAEVQIRKFGGTDYEMGNFEAELFGEPFLSKGELNEIRREIIQFLNQKKQELKKEDRQCPRIKIEEAVKYQKHPIVEKPLLSIALPDTLCAEEDISSYIALDADEIVIPLLPDLYLTSKWLNQVHQEGKRTVLALSRVMNSWGERQFLKDKSTIMNFQVDTCLVPHYEGLQLLKDSGLNLEAGMGLHCFNRASAAALQAWGCSCAELSPELTGQAAEKIALTSDMDLVMTVFGFQEMMISKNCLMNCKEKHCEICQDHELRILEDERGARFPFYRDLTGTTKIFNTDKLFLKRQLFGVKHVSKWRIQILNESPEEITEVIDFYKKGFLMQENGILSKFKGRYTTGNFKREVE